MKKVLVSLISVSLLVVPAIALAQYVPPDVAPTLPICCGSDSVLARVTNWLFVILLVVATMAIIIAGYLFVTATGDPDKTKRARDFVLYALIGVLVAFAAKGLIWLVDTIVMGY